MKSVQYWGILATVVSLATLGFFSPSYSQDKNKTDPKVLTEYYDDWTLVCRQHKARGILSNETTAKTVRCSLGQTVVDIHESDAATQPFSMTTVLYRKKKTGELRLKIVAPLGVDMQAGVSAQIDSNHVGTIKGRKCLVQGCFFDVPLSDEIVKWIRGGNKLHLLASLSETKFADVSYELSAVSDALDRWHDLKTGVKPFLSRSGERNPNDADVVVGSLDETDEGKKDTLVVIVSNYFAKSPDGKTCIAKPTYRPIELNKRTGKLDRWNAYKVRKIAEQIKKCHKTNELTVVVRVPRTSNNESTKSRTVSRMKMTLEDHGFANARISAVTYDSLSVAQ